MPADYHLLVRDLALDDQNGTPAVIVVGDYREREDLAEAIRDEAEVYGITATTLSDPAAAAERLPTLRADRADAAILLINAEQVPAWAPLLESFRESLTEWTRFVIVFLMEGDLPAFAQHAPAFFSWGKNRVYTSPSPAEPPQDELAIEMQRMHAETGLGPQEYIQAWQEGRISDTHEHSVWLNMARAVTGEDEP